MTKYRYFLLLPLLLQPLLIGEEADFDELSEFDDEEFLLSKKEDELIGWSLFQSKDQEDTYVINFIDVSMIEFVRFVSKISHMNFQYDLADLNYTLSITAEDPLTVRNIVAILIQNLRSHGLSVLEQENNLILTKSKDINMLPTIYKSEKEEKAPIITRVFTVKNANPTTVGSILRPMLSQGAIVDVLLETRQLLVTDITPNVDKIATLIELLDSSKSALEVEVYHAKHVPTDTLMLVGRQVLEPFIGTAPFLLVPQEETNNLFVVTTPALMERAIEILEDIDSAPKRKFQMALGDRVYLYRITNRKGDELINAVKEIICELQETGTQSSKLIGSLETAKWIPESNSLLFITDAPTQTKIEAILKTLDTPTDARNYFVYKMEKAGKDQMETSLQQLSKSLKKSPSERELVDAINSMRYIKETNSLIFTGTDESLKKLRELLPTFDTAISEFSPTSHYWLYSPQYLTGKELEGAIADLEDRLSSSGLSNEALLHAISSMKWVPSTNTLLFTGSPSVLENIQAMIRLIDAPTGSQSRIFIYKPQALAADQIEVALDELADKLDHKNLSDRNLAQAIDNMTWIPDSQIFIFKGDAGSIDKIQSFLKDLDLTKEVHTASHYFLYNLKYALGPDVILRLEKIAKNLPDKDPNQKLINKVIKDLSYLKEGNALLLTGNPKAIEEVKALIAQFDVPGATPALEKTSFFIYKPINLPALDLEEALKATAEDLKHSGLVDPVLLESIDTMRVVDRTNSLLFTGTKESLEKTKEILANIDIPGGPLGEFAGHTFFIYKVRYLTVPELMRLVQNVIVNLERERSDKNIPVIKALKSAKEIKETNSVIFTGPSPVMQKVAELMKQLDIPGGLGEGELGRQAGSFVIYKPVNVPGPDLIDMVQDFQRTLKQSGIREDTFFETIDNLKYIDRSCYVLISGDEKAVERVQELLLKFDVPGKSEGGLTCLTKSHTSFLIYKLHYNLGDTIQETLKKIGQDLLASDPNLDKEFFTAINSIQWIKMTNSLLATGNPTILTQLKEVIQSVDVPLRQVFIEVLIVQTTLSNNQQFGLQWGSKVQFLDRFAGGISNFPSPNPVTGSTNNSLATPLGRINATATPLASDIVLPSVTAGGFDLGVIGDIILHKGKTFLSLASLVNALQQDNDSVVIMNPKIVAQDNQVSSLFVGQNIPFAGSSIQTTQGGGIQTAANIEYRDVGVSLNITPILGADDIVTLDITNEITQQVNSTTSGVQGITGLQTSRTSLNARVHVPNKHFVALSGMITDQKNRFKSGIPCLGGLPVIGAIFSENDRIDSRNNIVFFVRPIIIDSIEEYKRITENQECLLKDVSIKQFVKEEIDEGIDWVKTPENE